MFVDLGAHAGCYTLCAARAVGAEGRVVAIEADPRTVERLRRNVQLNAIENVTIVAEGASDADELRNLSMNVSKNSGAGSFLISVGEDTPVRCRPLLDMLLELGVRRVTGLKADIEGFEYRVLQRFLADAPEHLWPGFVVVEQKEWWVDQAGGNTVDLLAAHGYRAAWHTGDRRSWRNYAMLRSAKGSAWES